MRRTLGLVLGLVFGITASAQASTITINAGATLAGNAAALAAFNRAANTLGSLFTDAVTVQIDADLADLGNPSIIGQASSNFVQASYTTIRNQMATDAGDEADDTIVAALPTVAQFLAAMPSGFSLNGLVALTRANAKALGFAVGAGTDGTITFNSTFAFDYDNSDGVGAGLVDFETVALHEIVHSMGFVSWVDDIDFLRSQNQTGSMHFTPLDMFRFSTANQPTTVAQFTTNARNFVPNSAAFTSDVANSWGMSTGFYTGDGRQASHWKDDSLTGNNIGVMDPTLGNGVFFGMSAADIRALDLIGWDFVPAQTAVPEPASMVLLGSGLVAVVRARRRKQ